MQKYEAVAAVQLGQHLCFLYETEEQQRAFVTPFLRTGLERNEKVIYAAHAHTPQFVLSCLEKDGLETAPYIARGQLVVVSAAAAYLPEGVFDPQRMIALIRAETARAFDRGYSGLRITGDLTWALDEPPGSQRLAEYEAKLNTFFPGSSCLALCQYHQKRFSPLALLNALLTHPLVATPSGIYENFYYLPAEDLLGNNVPVEIFRQCMKNLVSRKGLECELGDARQQFRMLIQERIAERKKAASES